MLAACGAEPTQPPAPSPAPTSAPTRVTSPLADISPAAAEDREFTGIVRERLPAGTYVYLGVESDRGLRWVATTGSTAAIGAHVHVQSMGTRRDFHSRRLDRSFDELVFGVVVPAALPERTNT